jgi:glutathione S-transferase
LKLYTFLISHFSEKVRWTLDHARVPYEEKPLPPGLHIATIRWWWRAPRTSVPVLVRDGKVLQGSGAILDEVIGPATERGREIEAMADEAFGLGVQRVFYASLLEEPRLIREMWSQGAPFWARAFYAVALKPALPKVAKMYDTRPESVLKAKDTFRRGFDMLDPIVEKQPFLLGDEPTRTDFTVAALLAPVCRPPEHPLKWPDEEGPPSLTAFTAELKERPTTRYVLRMYREHRR